MHPVQRSVTRLFVIAMTLVPAAAQGSAEDWGAVRSFADRWCVACHGAEVRKADLDLRDLGPATAAPVWRDIRDMLERREMPPADQPQPDDGLRAAFAGLIASRISTLEAATPTDPGKITVRRLSRVEYANTVRDLLGVDCDAVKDLPSDDLGYGFDNIGDALSFSLLHLEKFQAAAEEIAAKAVDTEDPDNPPTRRFEAEEMALSGDGVSVAGDRAAMVSSSHLSQGVKVPRAGTYRVRILAFGDQAGDEPPKMEVRIDGGVVVVHDVAVDRRKPATFEIEVRLAAGERMVAVAFINDYWNPKAPRQQDRDRNLHVDWMEVTGPHDRREPSDLQRRLLATDSTSADVAKRVRPVIDRLASRAWRRPAGGTEITRLCDLVKKSTAGGSTYAEGLRLAAEAILTSPHFLFRFEPSDEGKRAGTLQELSAYALASRLSYFIWSSMPDDRLLDLAKTRKLAETAVLEAEVRRMLDDDRGRAMAENFAAQWLELRALEDAAPDPGRFPEFDEELRRALRREAELFFDEILRFRRPARDLLGADFTYLNERLARHYGIDGVKGPEMRRVQLTANPRSLVTLAAMHVVTSNPTRTSPVKRGKWILENLLDAAPKAPPPGADSFPESDVVDDSAGLRQAMARHRSVAECASCHARMDGLGLALENFDAIGRYRTEEAGRPIDATGELPSGRVIDGHAELATMLRSDGAFLRSLTKKLFVYGVGRDVSDADRAAVEAITRSLPAESATIGDIVVAIVKSEAFRKRRPGS